MKTRSSSWNHKVTEDVFGTRENSVSMDFRDKRVPQEAIQALQVIVELLGNILLGVYLYGSAVMDGLQRDSDVDIMVVTNHALSGKTRKDLTESLMLVSGKTGAPYAKRPLEVTVINREDVFPWKYPPKYEFLYGEWLRKQFEQGKTPAPKTEPDLAILLAQLRSNSISLYGPKAEELLAPVPMTDIRKAIEESLPVLITCRKGDERNVILTLARMWQTVSTGEISSKNRAAQWAIPQLSSAHARLLDNARKAYIGEYIDRWEEMDCEVDDLVNSFKSMIEDALIGK